MGEILGLGMTHYPPLIGLDENMAGILRTSAQGPRLARALPRPGQLARGDAPRVRRRRGHGARRRRTANASSATSATRRKILDDFQPEVVVIWGDDQHENFTEDIIPPFCVLAYDQVEARPWQRAGRAANVWGEGRRTPPSASTGIARPANTSPRRLLEQGVDMPYAYKPLHHPGLAHAFLNTIMFLDYDRVGFPVSGGRVPGELLRPARDRPARRAAAAWPTRCPTPTSIRRRPRPSAAWKWARPRRARCARAPGAPR